MASLSNIRRENFENYENFENHGNFLWKMGSENYFQALFNFPRILCKKESEERHMLILTNFDSFAITYLIWAGCFRNFIFQKFFSNNSLQKLFGASFQVAVFVEFFDKNFSFVILDKLAKCH